MSDYIPTSIEWLQAQVHNMQFKVNIQREKNKKLQEILESSKKCTDILAKLIKEPAFAINLAAIISPTTQLKLGATCYILETKYLSNSFLCSKSSKIYTESPLMN